MVGDVIVLFNFSDIIAFLQKIAAFYHLLHGSTVLLRTFMAQIAVEFLLNFWHRSTFYLG